MFFRLLAVALLIATATPAFAGEAITEQMVAAKNAELAKLLNDRQNTNGSTQYMHEHIAENAKFELSVNNPAMPEAASGQSFQMNKADYINSYIQGPVYISNYNIAIKTASFAYDAATGEARSRDIITERGTLQSPRPDAKAGKDMVSTTTCETTHTLKDGKLATTGAKCHTEVSFEESV
jgi:hypothetical protein